MLQLHINRRFSQVARAFLLLVAVLGPALLVVLPALYIGRPSLYFLATVITLADAIVASDGWIHRVSPLDHRSPGARDPDCILDFPSRLRGPAAVGIAIWVGRRESC